MSRLRTLWGAASLVLVLALLAAGSSAGSATRTLVGCGSSYKYSGNQDPQARSGIRATISTIVPPSVITGHTAAWVGVGGLGLGPHGTDEWLQSGYSGFTTGQKQIYYEVTTPGVNPEYHTVQNTLDPSEKHSIAVVEVKSAKPGTWQVIVDNKPVSPPVYLPGSNGKFQPQAIGESWNDASTTCNSYNYGFANVQIANTPGGSWIPAKLLGYAWNDKTDQTVRTSATAFVARSRGLTAAGASTSDVPPLLGSIASKLTGRHLSATCADQKDAVVEQPAGHLVFSNSVCETLIGYAMAMPGAPPADTARGKYVARTTLAFLRGVDSFAPKPPADPDCHAVGKFASVLPILGATPAGARELRTALLADNDQIEPKLSLGASCPFQVKKPFTPPQRPASPSSTTPAAPAAPAPPGAPATPATPTTPAAPATPAPATAPSLTVTVHTSSPFGTAPNLTGIAPSSSAISYSPAGQAANVTGTLTCATTATASSDVGSYPITGCSGLADAGFDVVYDLAASSHTIVRANQTITFGPIAGHAVGDPDFSLAATSGSGLPVSYTAAGACTVSGSTVHLTGTGTCSITAAQAGTGNVNPAASVTQSFAVGVPPISNGTVDGHDLAPSNGGHADFRVDANGASGLHGAFSYDPPGGGPPQHFAATTFTSLSIAADGKSATFSGVGTGGQQFVVFVQDNGGSAHDVFVLTIAGVVQTGDGSLSHGQVEIHPQPAPPPGP
jgi:hypothetical protein